MGYHVTRDSSGNVEILSEREYQSRETAKAVFFGTICAIVAILYLVATVVSFVREQYHDKICGWTDLMLLVDRHDVEVGDVENAIAHGQDVNAKGRDGNTALIVACKDNKNEIAQKLLEHGARVNVMNDDKETPLQIATMNNNEELIQLLENPSKLTRMNKAGIDSALKEIASSTDSPTLAEQPESRSEPSRQNKGDSGRPFAETEERTEPRPLISDAVIRSTPEPEPVVSISEASLSELRMIQGRLERLKCRSSESRWYRKRILEIIPHILQGEGLEYTGSGMKGNTCLHYACELGSRQLIHWLVENGADVNAVEYGGGNTPLHNSARLASLHTITYLLEHGANPNVRNNQGELPVEVVGKDDHDAIVAKLREYM